MPYKGIGYVAGNIKRDPKAPGMAAGSGLKSKPKAPGRLKQKAMKSASGMRY